MNKLLRFMLLGIASIGLVEAKAQCGVQSLPYTENFNTWPPSCWDITLGTSNVTTSSSAAQFNYWFWFTGTTGIMRSDSISISTDARVKFKWSSAWDALYPGDRLTLRMRAVGTTNWDTLWHKVGSELVSNDGATPSSPGSYVSETILLNTSYTGSIVEFEFYGYSGYGPDVFIDDFTVDAIPSCLEVMGLMTTSVGSTSADLSWTSAGTKFNIEYGPAGYTQGTGTAVSSTSTTHTLTSLTSNTCYDVYVQNDCTPSNGLSTWTGPISFCTSCLPQAMTFTENFNTWPINCFSFDDGDVAWVEYPDSTNSHVEAKFYSNNDASFIMTTPPITISQSAQVKFDWSKAYSATYPDDSLYVYVYESGSSTKEMIYSFGGPAFNTPGSGNTSPGTFAQAFAYLDPVKYNGKDVVIEFVGKSDWGPNLYIDNVVVEPLPPCPLPIGLDANHITGSSAVISWVGAGTKFNIEYGPTGFTQGTGITIVAMQNSDTLNGLSANTCYDFYVQNDCSPSSGLSQWSGPHTFCTSCAIHSMPYTENFDSWPISCFDVSAGDQDWSEYVASAGSHAQAAFYNFNDVQFIMRTTPIMISQSAQIKFEWSKLYDSAYPDDSLYVFVYEVGSMVADTMYANGGPLFNSPGAGNFAPGTFIPELLYMDSLKFNGKQVIVELVGKSDWGPDLFIDNLVVEAVPNCKEPTGLAISNLTNNSVVLHWDSVDTQYNIEYGPAGFSQGTGMTVIANTNSDTLTGLTQNTCYDYFVQSDCGSGLTSTWAGPYTFCTKCDNKVAPWFDNLDGGGWVAVNGNSSENSIVDPCWSSIPNTTTYPSWRVSAASTSSSNTGPAGDHTTGMNNFAYLECSGGALGDYGDLTSPLVDVSGLTMPSVEFYYHMYGVTMGKLIIYASYDGGPFMAMDSIIDQQHFSDSAAYSKRTVVFDTGISTVQVRFRGVRGSNYESDMAIDDVFFKEAPSCPEIKNIMSTFIDGHSADISWTGTFAASQYLIEYGPQGFYQSTGNGIIDTSTTTSHTLTGLMPVTCYDVYVKADCGTNGMSDWEGPFTFCTTVSCPAPSGLTLVSSSKTSATFSWTTGGANSWNYVNVPQGFGPGVGTVVYNSSNPATLTGLTAGTGYSFYVRDSCGPGDVSTWVGPFDYATPLCDTSQKCDYTVYMHDSWGDGWNGYEFGIEVGGVTFESFGETFTNSGAFPPVDFEDTAYFSTCNGYPTNVVIHVVGQYETEISFEIVSASGDTVFAMPQGGFTTSSTNPLGNFVPSCLPISCPLPDSLGASAITASSALLGWASSGNNFQVSWGMMPFTASSGTMVSATTNSHTLNALMGNTNYGFYVREICTVGDTSFWAGPYSFNTLCPTAFNTPFGENMDGANWMPDNSSSGPTFNDVIDQCWSRTSSSGNYNWAVRSGGTGSSLTGPSADASGSGNYLFVEASSPADTGDVAELISPTVDLSSVANVELSFSYHFYGAHIDKMIIDGYDGVNWIEVDSIVGQQHSSSIDPWKDTTISFANFSNADFQFRFRAIRGVDYEGDLAIDEVMLTSSSACPAPANVNVSASCDSATVTWTSDPSVLFTIIRWDTTGFNPMDTSSGNTLVLAQSPLNIGTLMPGQTYDIWIIDSCATGTSATMATFTAATAPLPTVDVSWMQADTTMSSATVNFDATKTMDGDTYTWTFGDGSMLSGAMASKVYNANGQDSVTLSVTNGCGTSDTTFVITVYGIGIEESIMARSMKVYPNPTNGMFSVEFQLNGVQPVEVVISNTAGQIVYTEDFGNASGQFRSKFDLSNESDGIYIIQIKTGDGTISKRISKQ